MTTTRTANLARIVLVLGVIGFMCWIENSMRLRENSIERNKFLTVAKIVDFESNRSFSNYSFVYFYNGKKYNNMQDIDEGGGDTLIGKYFQVELSMENPEFSKVFINHEITNNREILKSGFNQ